MSHSSPNFLQRPRRGAWTALAVVLPSAAAYAQPVFAPMVPTFDPQAANTFFSTNGNAAASIQSSAAPYAEARNPFRIGPFAPHYRIDYQYINASGIRQGDSTVSTIEHLVSPGFSMQLSRQWSIDAGLSMVAYTDKALDNSIGYNVGIHGGIPRENWMFGVSAGFASTDTTQAETAQQTKQDSYSVYLSAVYGRGRRVTYDFSLGQNIALSGGFNDSYSWSTMNWVNYVATTKTTVGLGAGGGYNMLQAGSESLSSTGTDSVNEQLQARIVWNPVPKLSINLSGGAQFQQFLADDVDTSVSPIYSLSAGWTPVNGTSFSLSGSRTVGTALLTDDFSETTSISFGFSQRLLSKFTLGITPSYTMTQYTSNTDPTADASRSDDGYSINVSLSTVLFKKVAVSTFFQYSRNDSDDAFYSYDTRQFGLQFGYHF